MPCMHAYVYVYGYKSRYHSSDGQVLYWTTCNRRWSFPKPALYCTFPVLSKHGWLLQLQWHWPKLMCYISLVTRYAGMCEATTSFKQTLKEVDLFSIIFLYSAVDSWVANRSWPRNEVHLLTHLHQRNRRKLRPDNISHMSQSSVMSLTFNTCGGQTSCKSELPVNVEASG